jgi:hypothetical protein
MPQSTTWHEFAAALAGDDFIAHQHDSDNVWTTDHIDGFTGISTTDISFYATIPEDKVAVLLQGYMQLETPSDEIKVIIGSFAGEIPADTDTFTPIGMHLEAFSGTSPTGSSIMQVIPFKPPYVVKPSQARSIGFKVQVKDAGVEASFGVRGLFVEDFLAR